MKVTLNIFGKTLISSTKIFLITVTVCIILCSFDQSVSITLLRAHQGS